MTKSTSSDDHDDMKSTVEALRFVMKNEEFRNNFFKYMDKHGKSSFIKCFQKLDGLRKTILFEATRNGNEHEIAEVTIAASSSESTDLDEEEVSMEVNLTTPGVSMVIKDGHSLIDELKVYRRRNSQDGEKNISNAVWLKRILAAQEKLLTYLFEDFSEYLESEEVRSVRMSFYSSDISTHAPT